MRKNCAVDEQLVQQDVHFVFGQECALTECNRPNVCKDWHDGHGGACKEICMRYGGHLKSCWLNIAHCCCMLVTWRGNVIIQPRHQTQLHGPMKVCKWSYAC